MNNNINLKPTEKMGYINFWCQKVIPLVFDDSLSYYEAICKFMQKLNEVINALNNNAECIDELQGKYIILQRNFDALEVKWEEFKTYIENEFNTFKTEITTKEENFETTMNNEFNSFKTYVENYLNNIDVQSYVNIKIDELAESGYFSTLLTNLGFNPDNYLAKNNTTVYVPTDEYNPATKKYVDEHSSQGTVYNAGEGIKIENNTISSTNYNAVNNDKNGITITGCTIIGKDNNINSNDRNSIFGNNNTIGENITNSIIVGDQNNITGTSSFHNSNIIIGRQNTANKTHQTITLGNNNDVNLLNKENITLIGHNCAPIGFANANIADELNGSIIISNGITGNNHNAITITRTQNDGTLGKVIISNEIIADRFAYSIMNEKEYTSFLDKNIYPTAYEVQDIIIFLTAFINEVNLTLLNNFTGTAKLYTRGGNYYLYLNIIYPNTTPSGKEQDLDICKINTLNSETLGLANTVGVLVNKNDTSSREETRCIRITKVNNEITITYIAKDTSQNVPSGYTFNYFGIIGMDPVL